MNMGVDCARQNLALHTPSQVDIIHRALVMGDADGIEAPQAAYET